MDLYIRTQKREGLFKCDKLWYYYDDEENKHCICNYEFEFGTYKTKERALEVLDEIQERIINLQLVNLEEKGTARADAYKKTYLRCVYEMPKE